MDLDKLGELLRERRESLGIPRAKLARRVGISPSYMWTVEQAAKRKGGQPSQPTQPILEEWAAQLGLGISQTRELLRLAGHLQEEERSAAEPPLLAAQGFDFPATSGIEENLVRKISNLLTAPRISLRDRAEIQRLLDSFVAWLDFRYKAKE